MARRYSSRAERAFTLLELVTVVLVVAILVVISLPVFQEVQKRAAKSKCIANLRGLQVAANPYVQDHHAWPQIKNDGVSRTDVAKKWIARLQPYGLDQINWVCPTIQSLMRNPDLADPDNTRIDYTASPFDAKPNTPYQWTKQPWFAENGNMHGNGNLLVFSDGHVQELNDFLPPAASPGK